MRSKTKDQETLKDFQEMITNVIKTGVVICTLYDSRIICTYEIIIEGTRRGVGCSYHATEVRSNLDYYSNKFIRNCQDLVLGVIRGEF